MPSHLGPKGGSDLSGVGRSHRQIDLFVEWTARTDSDDVSVLFVQLFDHVGRSTVVAMPNPPECRQTRESGTGIRSQRMQAQSVDRHRREEGCDHDDRNERFESEGSRGRAGETWQQEPSG